MVTPDLNSAVLISPGGHENAYSRTGPSITTGHSRYVESMPLDEELLAQLKTTKAAIDELQRKLKLLVAELRQRGATALEIAEALRN